MTREEAKKFGLSLLNGIMERNKSYPAYADNVRQAIEALSTPAKDSLNIAPDPLANSAKDMPGKRAIQERDKILDVQDRLKDACYSSAKRLSDEIDRYLAEEVIVTPENEVVSKRHYFSGFYVDNLKDCACHFAEWKEEQILAAIKRLLKDKKIASTKERIVGAHVALLELLCLIEEEKKGEPEPEFL